MRNPLPTPRTPPVSPAPRVREQIWRCLDLLWAQGQTILAIDKHVKRRIRLADRHPLIERGKVVWQGASGELAGDPSLWHPCIVV